MSLSHRWVFTGAQMALLICWHTQMSPIWIPDSDPGIRTHKYTNNSYFVYLFFCLMGMYYHATLVWIICFISFLHILMHIILIFNVFGVEYDLGLVLTFFVIFTQEVYWYWVTFLAETEKYISQLLTLQYFICFCQFEFVCLLNVTFTFQQAN